MAVTAGQPDIVDLRSDTLTRPSDDMRRVMAAADVGDDVYGEDPEVNALEEEVADRFGREAALFVTSGVQANLLGMHVLARPGTEVIVEQDAHLVAFEVGSSAMFAGVQWRTVPGNRGRLDRSIVEANLRPGTFPFTEVSAVAVEETTNLAGGTFAGADALAELGGFVRSGGRRLWLDGARLFNAIVAGAGDERAYGAAADALTFCVSKGLGAPVGSVMVGDRDTMDEARQWRRRHGGAMRQVGVLAAAARFALANNVQRLAQDHAHAHALATAIAERRPESVDPADHPTNILYVGTGARPAQEIVSACRADGVIISAMGEHRLRIVTHLGVDAAGIARAAEVLTGHLTG